MQSEYLTYLEVTMKISIDEQSLKNVENNIRKSFEKVIRNQTMMKDVSDTIIKDIQFQTRSGKSIPLNQRFPPLTKGWRDRRKEIKSQRHNAFSPNRSNLTLSGQLVDSLKSIVVGAGRFIIKASGIHQPYYYEGKRGQRVQVGSKIDNEKLSQYVAEQGRPFIGVRKELIPRLKRIIIGYVRRSSKVLFKTNNNE